MLGGTGSNGEIVSATLSPDGGKFTGTAFGGGGYFEATLRFDPKKVDLHKGWPAFWADPIDHMLGLPSTFDPEKGPKYEKFVEVDFFEYDVLGENGYGGAMHEWYGVQTVTCKPQFCANNTPFSEGYRRVPIGTHFDEYHSYGFRWIPALKNRKGSATFYFDRQQVGPSVQWEYWEHSGFPSDKFSSLDRDHIFLILGTGKSEPMTVRSACVWQASAIQNISGSLLLKDIK